jgi:hypothetical protein
MSTTQGFEKATSFVLSNEPSVQAVWLVNAGQVKELSTSSISSSSRGGMGIKDSEAMAAFTLAMRDKMRSEVGSRGREEVGK